jgi:hypothetical protein
MSRLLLILAFHGASALPSGTLQHDAPTDAHAKIAALEAELQEFNARFDALKARNAALESVLQMAVKQMKNGAMHGATGVKKDVALVKSEAAQSAGSTIWDNATDGQGAPPGGPGGGGTELLAGSGTGNHASGEWSGWQYNPGGDGHTARYAIGSIWYSEWNNFWIERQDDGTLWLNCKNGNGDWGPNGVKAIHFAYYGSPYRAHGSHDVFAPFAIDCKWA